MIAPVSDSDFVTALMAVLDDEALAAVAERLRPHLVSAEGDAGHFLCSREAAARLGLHKRTIVRMAREGRIPGAIKVGRGWRFPAVARGSSLAGRVEARFSNLVDR